MALLTRLIPTFLQIATIPHYKRHHGLLVYLPVICYGVLGSGCHDSYTFTTISDGHCPPPSISDTSQRPSQKKNPFQSWVKIKQWMRRAGPAENGNCPATCNISHEEVTPRPPLNIPIIFLLRTKSTRCWVGLNWYLFILIRHYSHISRTSWIYVLYSSTCHHMHTLPWGISLNNPLLWNNQ